MTSATQKALAEGGFWQRNWQLVAVSFVGWSLLAAIPVTAVYIGNGAPGMAVWWTIFTKIGLYYYLWGLLAPFIYRLTDRLPYSGSGLLLTIPVHFVVMVVLSFALGLASHQEAWHEWLLGQRAPGYHMMSFFTYALIVLCCLALKFYRLSLLRQREASAARIQAAELDNKLNLARVDSLMMQMNPHFLFNALNSIAALIDSDQRDRAYQALERLGELLRHALKLSRADDVSLQQEVQFCKAYLAMEQIRFGERLRVNWAIEPDTLGLQVPAFVLQPSIENAIKHAVSLSSDTVTVTVSAAIVGDTLQLTVADDGGAAVPSPDSGGFGISNLQERLQLRFGNATRVESGPTDSGFRTMVCIPVKSLAAAPSA